MSKIELTPAEQKRLEREMKRKKEEIVAMRLPEEAMNELAKVMAIIDIHEFRDRKWFSGYDDGFHTLHGYRFGKDTDGKDCHVVFYLNFDIHNEYTSINIDTYNNNFGSAGILGTLLDYAGPYDERNMYSGLADALTEQVAPLKSLQEKADAFIKAIKVLDTKYNGQPFIDALFDLLDEQVQDVLGDPKVQTSSELKNATWTTTNKSV